MNLRDAEGELVGMCLVEPYAMALCTSEWGFDVPPFHGSDQADLQTIWHHLLARWQSGAYHPDRNDTAITSLVEAESDALSAQVMAQFMLRIMPVMLPVPEAEIDRVFEAVTEAWRLEDAVLLALYKLRDSRFGLSDQFDRTLLVGLATAPKAATFLAEHEEFRRAYSDALHQRHLQATANKTAPPNVEAARISHAVDWDGIHPLIAV